MIISNAIKCICIINPELRGFAVAIVLMESIYICFYMKNVIKGKNGMNELYNCLVTEWEVWRNDVVNLMNHIDKLEKEIEEIKKEN
jgi:hypothetical protein